MRTRLGLRARGEYWRRWTGSVWHICVDDPHDNALSYDPDIYSMRSLCDRHEFQRDKSRYVPWTREGTPKRVCKACANAAVDTNDSQRDMAAMTERVNDSASGAPKSVGGEE